MDSPKLRRHAPRRRGRTNESRGGRGSKQPRPRRRPRLLPPSPVAQNPSSPESIPRNGTGRGGIKRSCGRHAPQQLPPRSPHLLTSPRQFRPSPRPQPPRAVLLPRPTPRTARRRAEAALTERRRH